jgi:proline iminopeptidase
MVRITTHFFSHAAWLPESTLLQHAPRLTGIPGALFHGRLDLSSPLDTAWTLTQSWPEAHLTILEDAGHKGSKALRAQVRKVLDAYATT